MAEFNVDSAKEEAALMFFDKGCKKYLEGDIAEAERLLKKSLEKKYTLEADKKLKEIQNEMKKETKEPSNSSNETNNHNPPPERSGDGVFGIFKNAFSSAKKNVDPMESSVSPQMLEVTNQVLNAKNHWETLGLKEGASKEEVSKAYRSRARYIHPDKNPLMRADEAFKKLSRANEVLSNDESRGVYEQYGVEEQHVGFKDIWKNGDKKAKIVLILALILMGIFYAYITVRQIINNYLSKLRGLLKPYWCKKYFCAKMPGLIIEIWMTFDCETFITINNQPATREEVHELLRAHGTYASIPRRPSQAQRGGHSHSHSHSHSHGHGHGHGHSNSENRQGHSQPSENVVRPTAAQKQEQGSSFVKPRYIRTEMQSGVPIEIWEVKGAKYGAKHHEISIETKELSEGLSLEMWNIGPNKFVILPDGIVTYRQFMKLIKKKKGKRR